MQDFFPECFFFLNILDNVVKQLKWDKEILTGMAVWLKLNNIEVAFKESWLTVQSFKVQIFVLRVCSE